MSFPFTCGWIDDKCHAYIHSLKSFKSKNYKSIRGKIHKLCRFLCISLPITNILVLKNYYSKNSLIISIKPVFGKNKIIYVLRNYRQTRCSLEVLFVSKSYNEFEEFNCKERKQKNDTYKR